MRIRNIYYCLFFSVLFFIACNSHQNNVAKGQYNLAGYQLLKNWPQLPDNFSLGNPTGIGIDTNQHIFIFHRADRTWPLTGSMPDTFISSKTILMLDRESGKILSSWGNNLFIMPHGLTVDKNNNIWVTDVGLHQVFKFSHDGKLLLAIGEAKIPGNDQSHFNRPTDVAVTKDGSFYVSDGYGNSRVVKFSSTGQYLFEWGKKGDKESEFNLPHAIDLDYKENVYVADRENNRIQVFTPTGEFIKQWTNENFGKISSVAFDKEKNNFVAIDFFTSWFGLKHNGSEIILFDSSGNFINKFGKNYLAPDGIKCWYHDITVDDQGNIYVTDILQNRIQKFKKISGN